jgi:hypothetical protein
MRIKKFIADTFGGIIFRIILYLPHFKFGEKILFWVLENETPNPNETK